MLPLIQSGVFDVYTSTQQRDIVSDERSRGMEVDRGSAAVLGVLRWVCVRLCVYLPLLPPSDGIPSVAAYGSSLNL